MEYQIHTKDYSIEFIFLFKLINIILYSYFAIIIQLRVQKTINIHFFDSIVTMINR